MALATFQKWKYSVYTGIVLILLFNPGSFLLTEHLLRIDTVDENGTPTLLGYGLHLVLFILLLRTMMDWSI